MARCVVAPTREGRLVRACDPRLGPGGSDDAWSRGKRMKWPRPFLPKGMAGRALVAGMCRAGRGGASRDRCQGMPAATPRGGGPGRCSRPCRAACPRPISDRRPRLGKASNGEKMRRSARAGRRAARLCATTDSDSRGATGLSARRSGPRLTKHHHAPGQRCRRNPRGGDAPVLTINAADLWRDSPGFLKCSLLYPREMRTKHKHTMERPDDPRIPL